MAVTVFKTFIAGEVLTASDLNSSLTQLTNNGMDLWSPATEAADFDGQRLILDSDADTSITADTDDQIDFELVGADNFRMLIDAVASVPDFRAEWTDAGATVGPYISTYRNSGTPANDDFIGRFRFLGEDSAGNTEEYAAIACQIADVTSTSEDARIQFYLKSGGTERNILQFDSGADMRLRDFSADAAVGPVLILHRDSASPADADIAGGIDFDAEDDGSNQDTYARIQCVLDDVTATTEDGHLAIYMMQAGSLVQCTSPGIVNALTTPGAVATSDYTVRAGARRITVCFNGISTSGTSPLALQIGDSGGVETTGYISGSSSIDDTVSASVSSTATFLLCSTTGATDVIQGSVTLTLMDITNNVWAISGTLWESNNAETHICAGRKALSAELTTVRLTTVGGSDTFDAGSWSIVVE